MSKPRRLSIETVQLSDEESAAYDLLKRTLPKVTEARKLLSRAFGRAVLAETPDGRQILRSTKLLGAVEVNDYTEITAQ